MSLLGAGHNFSLASFMNSQADGLWYDFTKTDRLFQENTGPTPADDPGEAIGLALDQRTWGGKTLAQVLAAASELVTNGTFDSSIASWTDSSTAPATFTWDAATQSAKLVRSDANNARMDQSFTTVVGRTYRLALTVNGTVNISVGITQGGSTLISSAALVGTREFFFTATATTTWLRLFSSAIGTFLVDNVSIKYVPGNVATQANGTQKPALQPTGAKFDGSDDNLLTSYLAGSGANFIVALVTVPASLAAFQAIVGVGGAGRFSMGFGTDGKVANAIGLDTTSYVGSVDRRGQEVVIGLSCSGTLGRMFDDTAPVIEAAQSGAPDVLTPFRVGARNTSGTAGSFYGGSIKKLGAGREFLTLARYNQIRNALLAA